MRFAPYVYGRAALFVAVLISGCAAHPQPPVQPKLEFTRVPEARDGGPNDMAGIEGRATGVRPGQRIVLFARTDQWWVQPFADRPFTSITADAAWKGRTHYGWEYAALLVDSGFAPPSKAKELPREGGPIAAVARVNGRGNQPSPAAHSRKQIRFSGFDWDVRHQPSDRGGAMNNYDPANVWVDDRGRLHLKITKGLKGWNCAEVTLRDSLGYGTYSFTVANVSHLEPAAVLGFYTFDYNAPRQNHREMNIEVSRWGDPSIKNAQYAVQPYYVPANVVRFDVPSGPVTHTLRWTPGHAQFRSMRGSRTTRVLAESPFTSGVPTSGEEFMFVALYAYGRARTPLTRETEVVIDTFEYIP